MTTSNETRRQAWELRQTGMTFRQIAERLGLPNESSARAAANRHAIAVGAPDARNWPSLSRPSRRHRTFGVEMEFVGAPKNEVAALVQQATGQQHVPVTGYHGKRCLCCGLRVTKRMWRVEHDGSVSYGHDQWGQGGEIVTPVLRGESGLEQVRSVLRAVRNHADISVNERCGLHVHVYVGDMTNEGRASFVRTWMDLQPTLHRFIAKSRRNSNQYCYPVMEPEATRWSEDLQHGRRPNAERYRALNVTSYPTIGTFEVRCHQGTLNGRKVEAWTRLLVGIADAVHANETGRLTPGLALLGSLTDLGRLPQATAAYLTARVDVLENR